MDIEGVGTGGGTQGPPLPAQHIQGTSTSGVAELK